MHRFAYDFARPSVTATGVIFVRNTETNETKILLGKRRDKKGEHGGAYGGYFALPGGFLDAKIAENDINVIDGAGGGYHPQMFPDFKSHEIVRRGETTEETMVREFHEETNLNIMISDLKLFMVHSDPDTDPRCHVVNVCYYTIITREEYEASADPGDDLEELRLVTIDEVELMTLAFNHKDILYKAYDACKDQGVI